MPEELVRLRARQFKQQIIDAQEAGVDVQSCIEEKSIEYKFELTKLFGVRTGIVVICFAYITIIAAQIVGSFKGVKVDVDIALITATATAMSGILGYVFGKKKS